MHSVKYFSGTKLWMSSRAATIKYVCWRWKMIIFKMIHCTDLKKVITSIYATMYTFLCIILNFFCFAGWYVEFRLGPSLFGSDVSIYTNIPAEGSDFNRNAYNRLEWIREWSSDDVTNDDSSLSCLLQMNKAGSFHYYYELQGKK